MKVPFTVKAFIKELSEYFLDFFMSLLIGFGITLLLNLPLKFIRMIDVHLGSFVIHFVCMCIALYIRSYRKGYCANKSTYAFCFKKVFLFVGLIFAIQVFIVLLLGVKNGGHAVYVAGPSRWLAAYVLPYCQSSNLPQNVIFVRLNWLFMIGLDILVYAPIMIISEYLGAKRR